MPYLIRVLFPLIVAATATGQIHPPEPPVNLGDTTFLDAVAGPGLLVEETGDGYRSGTGRTSFNTTGALTHIAWISKHRILGACYAVELVAPAVHVHIGPVGSAGGLGDLQISPITLQWDKKKLGRLAVYQRIGGFGYVPTGEYRRSSAVNLSSHAFGINPYYAITALPSKHWETSWRVHYLWNSVNHSPPLGTGVHSMQAGQAVHFNATVGYALPHGLRMGANGYYFKQLTNPSVNGTQLPNSREQIGAIGPGAMWNLRQFIIYANFYHEIGAENRTAGNRLVLRLSWIPGRTRHEAANRARAMAVTACRLQRHQDGPRGRHVSWAKPPGSTRFLPREDNTQSAIPWQHAQSPIGQHGAQPRQSKFRHASRMRAVHDPSEPVRRDAIQMVCGPNVFGLSGALRRA